MNAVRKDWRLDSDFELDEIALQAVHYRRTVERECGRIADMASIEAEYYRGIAVLVRPHYPRRAYLLEKIADLLIETLAEFGGDLERA